VLSDHINAQNKEGWTAVHLAAFLNNFDTLNLLIESGADLQLRNSHEMTCFDEMVRNDHSDLLSCVYDLYKQMPERSYG